MRHRRALLLLAVLLGTSPGAATSEVPSTSGQLSSSFYIVEADLADVLEYIAIESGLTPVLEGNFARRIQSSRLSGSTSEILVQLGRDYQLDIMEYNNVLYVTTKELRSTRLIEREGFSGESVTKIIEAAKIPSGAYNLQQNVESNSVIVTGPPSTLGLIEAIVASAENNQQYLPDVIIERRGVEVSLHYPNGLPYSYVAD